MEIAPMPLKRARLERHRREWQHDRTYNLAISPGEKYNLRLMVCRKCARFGPCSLVRPPRLVQLLPRTARSSGSASAAYAPQHSNYYLP